MKEYSHKRYRIVKDAFRYRVPQLTWGSEPGEFHSFKTLKAAKEFIDRRGEGISYRLGGE